MTRRLPLFIALGLAAGIATGLGAHLLLAGEAQRQALAANLSIVTELFLRLVRMIVAPLVFSSLVVGVARMSDVGAMGRIAARTLGWFLLASVASLGLGATLANLLQPGGGLHLAATLAPTAEPPFSARAFLVHVVPDSFAAAMADNQVLQIVVFSLFVGAACLALGSRVASALTAIEQLAGIMLKVTEYVMLAAPLAVFAAVAASLAVQGPGILLSLAKVVGVVYLGLAILAAALLAAAALVLGRRLPRFLSELREPLLIAFATASSEAAYPKLLLQLRRIGVADRIASFVLPLGYSFNMDGAMMYCSFAVLFIAQAADVHLDAGRQVALFGLLLLSTKGLAGVPRASLVVITSALQAFRIPDAGLLLILAVDHLLDMGRTAMNVVGNAVAAVLVAAWERALADDLPEAADA